MGKKIESGDIFSIQVAEDQYGVGYVASRWKKEYYFILFEEKFKKTDLPNSVGSLTPLLASSSLDAKIYNGHWLVYAHEENKGNYPQPLYKIEENSGFIIESFDRKTRLPLNLENEDRFKYRKCVAPVRLERALNAFHGFEEWKEMYDDLLYDRLVFA